MKLPEKILIASKKKIRSIALNFFDIRRVKKQNKNRDKKKTHYIERGLKEGAKK